MGILLNLLSKNARNLQIDLDIGLRANLQKRSQFRIYTSNTIASSDLLNSIKIKGSGNENSAILLVTGLEYWRYANFGRGPGARPPIAKIEKWINDKGFASSKTNSQIKSLAFLISRKIAKKGTNKDYSFFATNAINRFLPNFKREIENQYTKYLITLLNNYAEV